MRNAGKGPPPRLQPNLHEVIEEVADRWPGRRRQVEQLVGLLGPEGAPAPNVLVHGGPSTGKTAIIRAIFSELQRPYVYVSCAEFSRPRHLLQSITNQLKGRKRARSEGFAGSFRGEHVADFLAELPGVAASAAAKHIVVDHAHRLADQEVLAALLRLRELSGACLGLVLISRLAWTVGAFERDTCAAPPPLQIAFPAHEPALLASILAVQPLAGEAQLQQQGGLEAFKGFLRAEILPVFARSTRRLEDLQALVAALFPLYLRPVATGSIAPTDGRRLHAAFQPTLLAAKAAFESGPGWKGALAGLAAADATTASKPRSEQLDLDLPFHAKFLLLAAHVCARNKPALDRRLFDLTAKGAKRRGHLSHDKQVEAAREAALRGPHAFPLERLLAVFWALLGSEGPPPQQADLLTQLSSLVTLRLLSRAAGDELDEPRFRCHIADSLAATVARNLGIRLQDYLLYA